MTQPVLTPPAGDPPAPTTPPAPAPVPPTPPAPPAPTTGTPPADDKPLGPGGEKALQAERDRAKALEKELAALAPLKQLAAALGGQPSGNGKTDLERLTERLTQHETDLETERVARWRAEVANTKGLTLDQAAELRGTTREELIAHAERLQALFPAAPEGPRTPAPDPTQGARGTQPADLDAQIAAAQKDGDVRKVIRLQKQKLNPTK